MMNLFKGSHKSMGRCTRKPKKNTIKNYNRIISIIRVSGGHCPQHLGDYNTQKIKQGESLPSHWSCFYFYLK